MMTIIVVEVAVMLLTVIQHNKHIHLRLALTPPSAVATEKRLERRPTRKPTALTEFVTM
jgi:hypothetical protein